MIITKTLMNLKSKCMRQRSQNTLQGGKKRSFGVPIWSEEGKTLEKGLQLTWGAAFRDKDVRDWMSVGWEHRPT